MLPVLGKKAVLEWCMKEGLIGPSYVCPKCGKSMELRERTETGVRQISPSSIWNWILLGVVAWLMVMGGISDAWANGLGGKGGAGTQRGLRHIRVKVG
ncbi:hypothetical protein TNCV_4694951 [Trichonephila clavipes]|nr:hypothetical protein TNCV_4694951 [Trichonephila clavipes]